MAAAAASQALIQLSLSRLAQAIAIQPESPSEAQQLVTIAGLELLESTTRTSTTSGLQVEEQANSVVVDVARSLVVKLMVSSECDVESTTLEWCLGLLVEVVFSNLWESLEGDSRHSSIVNEWHRATSAVQSLAREFDNRCSLLQLKQNLPGPSRPQQRIYPEWSSSSDKGSGDPGLLPIRRSETMPVIRETCSAEDMPSHHNEDGSPALQQLLELVGNLTPQADSEIGNEDEVLQMERILLQAVDNWTDNPSAATNGYQNVQLPNNVEEITPVNIAHTNDDNFGAAAEQGEYCNDLWSTERAVMLEIAVDALEASTSLKEHLIWNTQAAGSVRRTVDALNKGIIACAAGFCITFSTSAEAYFLLYKHGRRKSAVETLQLQERPHGHMFLHIVGAHDLPNVDSGIFGDVSDPFVVARLGEIEHNTEVVYNNLSPIWNVGPFEFAFDMMDESLNCLTLEVFDHNNFRQHVSLGTMNVHLSELQESMGEQIQIRRNLSGGVDGGGDLEIALTLHCTLYLESPPFAGSEIRRRSDFPDSHEVWPDEEFPVCQDSNADSAVKQLFFEDDWTWNDASEEEQKSADVAPLRARSRDNSESNILRDRCTSRDVGEGVSPTSSRAEVGFTRGAVHIYVSAITHRVALNVEHASRKQISSRRCANLPGHNESASSQPLFSGAIARNHDIGSAESICCSSSDVDGQEHGLQCHEGFEISALVDSSPSSVTRSLEPQFQAALDTVSSSEDAERVSTIDMLNTLEKFRHRPDFQWSAQLLPHSPRDPPTQSASDGLHTLGSAQLLPESPSPPLPLSARNITEQCVEKVVEAMNIRTDNLFSNEPSLQSPQSRSTDVAEEHQQPTTHAHEACLEADTIQHVEDGAPAPEHSAPKRSLPEARARTPDKTDQLQHHSFTLILVVQHVWTSSPKCLLHSHAEDRLQALATTIGDHLHAVARGPSMSNATSNHGLFEVSSMYIADLARSILPHVETMQGLVADEEIQQQHLLHVCSICLVTLLDKVLMHLTQGDAHAAPTVEELQHARSSIQHILESSCTSFGMPRRDSAAGNDKICNFVDVEVGQMKGDLLSQQDLAHNAGACCDQEHDSCAGQNERLKGETNSSSAISLRTECSSVHTSNGTSLNIMAGTVCVSTEGPCVDFDESSWPSDASFPKHRSASQNIFSNCELSGISQRIPVESPASIGASTAELAHHTSVVCKVADGSEAEMSDACCQEVPTQTFSPAQSSIASIPHVVNDGCITSDVGSSINEPEISPVEICSDIIDKQHDERSCLSDAGVTASRKHTAGSDLSRDEMLPYDALQRRRNACKTSDDLDVLDGSSELSQSTGEDKIQNVVSSDRSCLSDAGVAASRKHTAGSDLSRDEMLPFDALRRRRNTCKTSDDLDVLDGSSELSQSTGEDKKQNVVSSDSFSQCGVDDPNATAQPHSSALAQAEDHTIESALAQTVQDGAESNCAQLQMGMLGFQQVQRLPDPDRCNHVTPANLQSTDGGSYECTMPTLPCECDDLLHDAELLEYTLEVPEYEGAQGITQPTSLGDQQPGHGRGVEPPSQVNECSRKDEPKLPSGADSKCLAKEEFSGRDAAEAIAVLINDFSLESSLNGAENTIFQSRIEALAVDIASAASASSLPMDNANVSRIDLAAKKATGYIIDLVKALLIRAEPRSTETASGAIHCPTSISVLEMARKRSSLARAAKQCLDVLLDIIFAKALPIKASCPVLTAERCRAASLIEDLLIEWRWGMLVPLPKLTEESLWSTLATLSDKQVQSKDGHGIYEDMKYFADIVAAAIPQVVADGDNAILVGILDTQMRVVGRILASKANLAACPKSDLPPSSGHCRVYAQQCIMSLTKEISHWLQAYGSNASFREAAQQCLNGVADALLTEQSQRLGRAEAEIPEERLKLYEIISSSLEIQPRRYDRNSFLEQEPLSCDEPAVAPITLFNEALFEMGPQDSLHAQVVTLCSGDHRSGSTALSSDDEKVIDAFAVQIEGRERRKLHSRSEERGNELSIEPHGLQQDLSQMVDEGEDEEDSYAATDSAAEHKGLCKEEPDHGFVVEPNSTLRDHIELQLSTSESSATIVDVPSQIHKSEAGTDLDELSIEGSQVEHPRDHGQEEFAKSTMSDDVQGSLPYASPSTLSLVSTPSGSATPDSRMARNVTLMVDAVHGCLHGRQDTEIAQRIDKVVPYIFKDLGRSEGTQTCSDRAVHYVGSMARMLHRELETVFLQKCRDRQVRSGGNPTDDSAEVMHAASLRASWHCFVQLLDSVLAQVLPKEGIEPDDGAFEAVQAEARRTRNYFDFLFVKPNYKILATSCSASTLTHLDNRSLENSSRTLPIVRSVEDLNKGTSDVEHCTYPSSQESSPAKLLANDHSRMRYSKLPVHDDYTGTVHNENVRHVLQTDTRQDRTTDIADTGNYDHLGSNIAELHGGSLVLAPHSTHARDISMESMRSTPCRQEAAPIAPVTSQVVELVVDLLTGSAPSAGDLYATILHISSAIATRLLTEVRRDVDSSSVGSASTTWQTSDHHALAGVASRYLSSLMEAVVERLAVRETLSLECAWQDGCDTGCASHAYELTLNGLRALLTAVYANLAQQPESLQHGTDIHELQAATCRELHEILALRDRLHNLSASTRRLARSRADGNSTSSRLEATAEAFKEVEEYFSQMLTGGRQHAVNFSTPVSWQTVPSAVSSNSQVPLSVAEPKMHCQDNVSERRFRSHQPCGYLPPFVPAQHGCEVYPERKVRRTQSVGSTAVPQVVRLISTDAPPCRVEAVPGNGNPMVRRARSVGNAFAPIQPRPISVEAPSCHVPSRRLPPAASSSTGHMQQCGSVPVRSQSREFRVLHSSTQNFGAVAVPRCGPITAPMSARSSTPRARDAGLEQGSQQHASWAYAQAHPRAMVKTAFEDAPKPNASSSGMPPAPRISARCPPGSHVVPQRHSSPMPGGISAYGSLVAPIRADLRRDRMGSIPNSTVAPPSRISPTAKRSSSVSFAASRLQPLTSPRAEAAMDGCSAALPQRAPQRYTVEQRGLQTHSATDNWNMYQAPLSAPNQATLQAGGGNDAARILLARHGCAADPTYAKDQQGRVLSLGDHSHAAIPRNGVLPGPSRGKIAQPWCVSAGIAWGGCNHG